FPDFPSQCILGDLFQRPVDHVSYRVYAATEGPLNGDYYLGGSEEAGFFEMNLVDEAHEFFVSASLVAPDTPTLVILTLPTITPAFKVKTSFTRIQENLLSFL
ncbi:MAG: hypothetical protein KA801_18335, partial [Syntrophorhabdaceae bacterium]|nr:hypothetical protein [Syntrophorhabdaceae bacterium]